jgi:D-alanyl-D-alanine dipeptidase
MILLSDPRVQRVPVRECGEPLAQVADVASLRLDERERDVHEVWGQVRAGVLERLQVAAATLPADVTLVIIEGRRSQAEQQRRFDAYADKLRQTGVTDPTQLRVRTSAFVSPVEVAPHCAGAAVDVTLVDGNGAELDMGGPVNGHRFGAEASCPMEAAGISDTARRHRQLLAAAMGGAGFVNYPPEWWHWSYGDRYWALATGAENALYGPV